MRNKRTNYEGLELRQSKTRQPCGIIRQERGCGENTTRQDKTSGWKQQSQHHHDHKDKGVVDQESLLASEFFPVYFTPHKKKQKLNRFDWPNVFSLTEEVFLFQDASTTLGPTIHSQMTEDPIQVYCETIFLRRKSTLIIS